MTIQMLAAWNGLEEDGVYTLAGAEETRLIAAGLARAYSSGIDSGSGPAPLYGAYSVSAGDDGRTFYCAAALTVTLSEASGSVIIFPPPTGNLTISVSGSATHSGGSTSPLTRALATGSNRLGIAIIRNPGGKDFGISGA